MNLNIEHVEKLVLHFGGAERNAVQAAGASDHAFTLESPEPGQQFAWPWPKAPKIGELWPEGGGYYAGLFHARDDGGDFHLILSPADAGVKLQVPWGPSEDLQAATSDWDGKSNTLALLSNAAKSVTWLKDSINGFTDWYLPSKRELAFLWAQVGELFGPGWYWSSTQYSRFYAWGQLFDDGYQLSSDKSYEGRARVVRRFSA